MTVIKLIAQVVGEGIFDRFQPGDWLPFNLAEAGDMIRLIRLGGPDCDKFSFVTNDDRRYIVQHLRRFIGRVDIAGKEIFEGDIVVDEWDYKWKVEYNNELSCFVIINLKHGGQGRLNHIKPTVIGNIYDNPELLEE